jgi:hypothetical protein
MVVPALAGTGWQESSGIFWNLSSQFLNKPLLIIKLYKVTMK